MTDSQQKKILYLVTLGNWGGAQKYVYDLSTALCPSHLVIVAAGGQDRQLEQRLYSYKIKYARLTHLDRPISLLRDWLAFWEIYQLLKLEQPDIVHLNSTKAGVLGSLAAKLAGVKKIIFTMHGLVLEEPLPAVVKLFYSFAEKVSAYFTDCLIAVSEAARQSALTHSLKKADKIVMIHNGLDFAELGFLPPQIARSQLSLLCGCELNNKKLIGTIADLYPAKGLIHLLSAAKIIDKHRQDLTFILLCRSGPEERKIKTLLDDLKLDRFFLVKNLSNAAIFLPAFDQFVLPSIKEGLPYTLLEAAAAKLPIVASAVGGIPELIKNGYSGSLVKPANPPELAQAILELIDHPEFAAHQGKMAYQAVQDFTLAKMVEKTKRVYGIIP